MQETVKKEIILCVDDDVSVLNALRTLISNTISNDYIIEIAESGEEALEIFQEIQAEGNELCVVISDFIMPNLRGDELLVRIHELSPESVKIMLTGQSSLQGIKRAINEANLYRFIEKPFDNSDMMLTLRSALHSFRQERELELRNRELEMANAHLEHLVAERTSELVEKNKQLEKLSITDRLTGLNNRLKLDQVIDEEFARCRLEFGRFALILLDIDKFKSINDTYGHAVGDMVLIEFANLLVDGIRSEDVAGRWGGEEFLIICPNTELKDAAGLAEHLRNKVAEHSFPVIQNRTSSFGVSEFRKGDTIAAMLNRADSALYRAKENGRNRVEF